jgi:hypothetical protein
MSSSPEPLVSHGRREFDWSAEMESPEELRLAPPPEEEGDEQTLEAEAPPSPEQQRRHLLGQQVRDLVRPLLWAMVYVGLLLGGRAWLG